jgi:hypothetical protein
LLPPRIESVITVLPAALRAFPISITIIFSRIRKEQRATMKPFQGIPVHGTTRRYFSHLRSVDQSNGLPASGMPHIVIILLATAGLISTLACTGRRAPTGASARSLQSGKLKPAVPTALPEFEVSISRVANLVHWIDNLAGSSLGKTVRVYRRYWLNRYGSPSPEERRMLQKWHDIRVKSRNRPTSRLLMDRGCLPQTAPAPRWRDRFRVRSYEAASTEEFVISMHEDLSDAEMKDLRAILQAFEPGFDEIWKEMTFLPRFKERFERFLEESELRPFLGKMAGFFGVDPAVFPKGRIHLMALPADSGTHAQANGRHLLMEIRPRDTPVEQIQVISHETAHYFWQLISPERNDELARQVHQAGPAGPVLWRLLRESLPTALGQGLAEAHLAPHRFGTHQRWYHIESIDKFAKEIYPVVEAAFRLGRTIDDGVLQKITERVQALPLITMATPDDYMHDVYYGIGAGMEEAYKELRSRQSVWSVWPYQLSDPSGRDFLDRFECLSAVILLSPAEAEDAHNLPGILAPPVAVGKPVRAGERGLKSSIQAVRRAQGGIVFYLIATKPDDLPSLTRTFLELRRVPDDPIYLN